MASKACGRCNLIKSVNDFNMRSASSDGYQSYCKVCISAVNQNCNNNNRDRLNERECNRIATNPQHQISTNIHQRLNHILKRCSYTARTEQVLGIPKGLYLDWLSFNFENNMCFANYGKLWH